MIRMAQPVFAGREREHVEAVLASTQLSMGPMVTRLERALEDACGAPHVLACSTGTAALHLAVAALGCGPGDAVLMPATTYIATANAVRYCGGTPVFADVDPATWQVRVRGLEAAEARMAPGLRVRGVIGVDLYGQSPNWPALRRFATARRAWLVEDAAEALGSARLGIIRAEVDAATFSFYGNKTATCGEGGAVATHDFGLARTLHLLRGQGQGPERYVHEVVGYNYRLTDLQAAVALGQVEMLPWHVRQRRQVHGWYVEALPPDVLLQATGPEAVPWVVAVLLPGDTDRTYVQMRMADAGVETRPVFIPMHRQPPYLLPELDLPVAQAIGYRGLCLPTHAALTSEDVRTVCKALRKARAEAAA